MTSTREIDKRSEQIQKGWPRPFYRSTINGDERRMHVQYVTACAEDQIFNCCPDAIEDITDNYLCSC